MRTVRAFGCGLILLTVGSGLVRAQEGGGINFVELFQQLDANGDFIIEKGEVPESGRPAFEQLLKEADKNKDGKIDREEYRDLLQGLRGAGGGGFMNGGERFKAMDKNGDGKLSRDEFQGPPLLFDRVDADKDGFITREEAAKARGAMAPGGGPGVGGERFKAMDKNGDGKVSREEFQGPAPMFQRLDANKDGFVTLAEAARAGGPGGPGGVPGPRFKAMDKNGDGKISREEWPGRDFGFQRLDADKDGSLTFEEFRAAASVFPGAGGLPGASKAARPGASKSGSPKDSK